MAETGFLIVRKVIAETFGVSPDSITRETTADDVDGWDSLSHTVLMIRLGRALGAPVSERLAAEAVNVGALADGLVASSP
jgi:acyl carrier protein